MTLEPKSSASTNFATPAGDGIVPEITAEEKFESISVKQTRLSYSTVRSISNEILIVQTNANLRPIANAILGTLVDL